MAGGQRLPVANAGLEGRYAVVCASSKGLGYACALELARRGCGVVLNGRSTDTLQHSAKRLSQATNAQVAMVAGDVADPDTQSALLASVPRVDILITNNAGPPFRDFRKITREDMLAGLIGNMIAPIELIAAALEGMVERRWGRVVNIASSSVRMPLPGLDLSSGARAGLVAFMAGVARDVAHANVTINSLLPGPFATDRLAASLSASASRTGQSLEQVRAARTDAIPARRFGDPAELGSACAFLCSNEAGFITGQSLLIDGGLCPIVL